MTIALGMMASNGIVLAADTQETDGYFKDFSLKLKSTMTHTSIYSNVKSALAITGCGPGVYLDAISDELLNSFHASQDKKIDVFESRLKIRVEEFYKTHVLALAPHIDRDFRLIVATEIEGQLALWTTDATVVKRVIGLEAVGTGSPFAKMAIGVRYGGDPEIRKAALLSILGVMRAREYDLYSGKSTSVICITDNVVHRLPWCVISEAEKLFERYAGTEYSAFQYALADDSSDEEQRPAKVTAWLQELRTEFRRLAGQMLKDRP